MDKRAEVITPLQPHQREALRRALAGNLVLAHSTGSGKTLTSIAAADAIGRPTVVLTPASLVENYRKELAKQVKKYAEDAKVAMRNIRRDGMDYVKKLKKNGDITEDDQKKAEKDLQDMLDKYIKKVDAALAAKDKELMSI